MLYIIPTPVGNLEDITLRAITTLKSVPTIIAENPNHTRKLLQHFKIEGKKFIQFAEHNELEVIEKLVSQLQQADAALVSDAGTPGISDPGFRLVRACVAAAIKIIPLPGPSAVITALSASGLPTDRFLFVGFLPKTKPKLMDVCEQAEAAAATLVAYESPQRIVKTILSLQHHYPTAHIVVARELTKVHEEFIRGTSQEVLSELQQRASIKGEITLLISFK